MKQNVNSLCANSESFVWHYTSLDILGKIFLEKEPRMRATHFKDFKDTNEIIFGAKNLLEVIKNNQQYAETKYCRFLEALVSDKRYRDDFYILSFSEEADSICHWKHYANDCKGCAIGFKKDVIVQVFTQYLYGKNGGFECYTPEFNSLIDCLYIDEDEDIQDRIQEIVNTYNWNHLPKELHPFERIGVFSKMFSIVTSIKKKKFEFEKETRLLLRYKEPKISKKYISDNTYPYLCNENKYLYCPLNTQILNKTDIKIMLAPNANIQEGENIVKRINRELNLSLCLLIGEASEEKCKKCSRINILKETGKCNA